MLFRVLLEKTRFLSDIKNNAVHAQGVSKEKIITDLNEYPKTNLWEEYNTCEHEGCMG